jgi:hypothetical protein
VRKSESRRLEMSNLNPLPIPPGAVVVSEREHDGVVSRVYEYPQSYGVGITRLGPAPTLREKGAQATSAYRPRPLPSLPEICRNQRTKVSRSAEVVEKISRLAFVESVLGDKEVAGFLVGHTEDGVIHVTRAVKGCREQTRTSAIFDFDREPRDSIGYWPTHPTASYEPRAELDFSDTDLRTAASRARSLRTLSLLFGRVNGRFLARGYDVKREGRRIVAHPVELLDGR